MYLRRDPRYLHPNCTLVILGTHAQQSPRDGARPRGCSRRRTHAGKRSARESARRLQVDPRAWSARKCAARGATTDHTRPGHGRDRRGNGFRFAVLLGSLDASARTSSRPASSQSLRLAGAQFAVVQVPVSRRRRRMWGRLWTRAASPRPRRLDAPSNDARDPHARCSCSRGCRRPSVGRSGAR